MNPIEKVQKTIWYECSKCKEIYISKEKAEECCGEKRCKICGCIRKYSYPEICDNCSEKRHFDRCEKITYNKYLKDYPKNMLTYNGHYSLDMEDLMSELYDCSHDIWKSSEDIPKYVYGTYRNTHIVDIENAIENALEETYEDAEFDNTKELIDFVDKWNKTNHIHSFYESDIAVQVPDDLRQQYIDDINKRKNCVKGG